MILSSGRQDASRVSSCADFDVKFGESVPISFLVDDTHLLPSDRLTIFVFFLWGENLKISDLASLFLDASSVICFLLSGDKVLWVVAEQATTVIVAAYSCLTNSPIFLSKDRAIVRTAIDGLVLKDHLVVRGDIVTSKNILFALKISNNRVCIYLSTKALVDEVVEKHSSIKVNDKSTSINKSCSSNCFVKCLSFDSPHPRVQDEFAHVLSFHRQIHVQPDDKISLPDSLVLKYDDTNFFALSVKWPVILLTTARLKLKLLRLRLQNLLSPLRM